MEQATAPASDDWFDRALFLAIEYPLLFVIALLFVVIYYLNKMRLEEKKDKRWAIGELLNLHDRGTELDEPTLRKVGIKKERRKNGGEPVDDGYLNPNLNGRHEDIVHKD